MSTTPTPLADRASEVVRAAVAWNAAWNRRQSGEYLAGTDSQCAYLETMLDAHCWKMNNAVEAYLAAQQLGLDELSRVQQEMGLHRELEDSAQHPTQTCG